MMARPRMDGGVMFDLEERAALDAVPETKRIVCGWCEKVTTFRRGILGDAVVYACENFCGSVSLARPVTIAATDDTAHPEGEIRGAAS